MIAPSEAILSKSILNLSSTDCDQKCKIDAQALSNPFYGVLAEKLKTQLGNPRPTFLPTQVGLGITQAVHCEVTHVSFCTVQSAISTSILVNLANPGISPPYYKKSFN